jgi:streptomycin 6-kinase
MNPISSDPSMRVDPLIPPRLSETIVARFGDDGRAWLAALPDRVTELAKTLGIRLEPPFPNASYSYVAPATLANGTPVVLKVGYRELDVRCEALALWHFDGRGTVRLLAGGGAMGAFVVERVMPGTPLSSVDDDERATSIAASIMRVLPHPGPYGDPLPTVAQWAEGFERLRRRFDGGTGPLPRRHVAKAESLMAYLLGTEEPHILLHGDLHHDNILDAGDGRWLAIDPQGVIGERAYETGALLRNLTPRLRALPHPEHVLERRIEQLAEELALDRRRIRDWAFAQAVLSAWWSIEDNDGDGANAIAYAELLDATR